MFCGIKFEHVKWRRDRHGFGDVWDDNDVVGRK